MNPKELRIGNYVSFKGESVEVYCIDRGGISFYRINDIAVNKETGCTLGTGARDYQAIPLTEEVLRASGFTKWLDGSGNLHLDAWSGGARHDIDYMPNEPHPVHIKSRYAPDEAVKHIQSLPHIRYLHQLQNLYFALTGEELEIAQ